MRKTQCKVATHAEVTRLGCISQWQLVCGNELCYLVGILLAQDISHTLVITDCSTGMELEHLLMEWGVTHHVPTDVPRNHIGIYRLHISFARLVVDGIIHQSILREVGA